MRLVWVDFEIDTGCSQLLKAICINLWCTVSVLVKKNYSEQVKAMITHEDSKSKFVQSLPRLRSEVCSVV